MAGKQWLLAVLGNPEELQHALEMLMLIGIS